MNVSFATYKDLDRTKWDACIRGSSNGLIYSTASYLDAMAAHWDALVLNDYEAVMALPSKMKWGIRYVYQPAFIQQLGIIGNEVITQNIQDEFFRQVLKHFRFFECTLNYANEFTSLIPIVHLAQRTNYVIDLQQGYKSISGNYADGYQKSMRRLRKFNLRYQESGDFEKAINTYHELYGKRLNFFSKNDFKQIILFCRNFQEGQIHVREVYNNSQELVASVMLLQWRGRLYNLISNITTAGRFLEANYFLYDQVIREFSESKLLLDLEGSDVKGIADFYSKLGPSNQPYPFARFNNLPPVIKRFKK